MSHKLQVLNPQSVEQVLQYLNVHFDKLDQIIENTKNEVEADEYWRHGYSLTSNADGTFQQVMEGRQGYDRVYEQVMVLAQNDGFVMAFLDVISISSCVACQNLNYDGYAGTGGALAPIGLAADATVNWLSVGPTGIYVPDQSSLIIQGFRFDASTPVGLNIQERRLKHAQNPHKFRHINLGDS